MSQAGAHFVVDSIADVMPVLASIEERMARGERP
jgi:phosphonoacetaldehyde hydrolase